MNTIQIAYKKSGIVGATIDGTLHTPAGVKVKKVTSEKGYKEFIEMEGWDQHVQPILDAMPSERERAMTALKEAKTIADVRDAVLALL